MRCLVMTGRHLADRWKVSLKILQRGQLDGEGLVWHKLFRHIRNHESDIIDFERLSAQHLMTLLGINRKFKPADEDLGEAFDAQGNRHLTAMDIAKAASLPIYLFSGSRRAQTQTDSTPDAGRQPAFFAAGDPGLGDGQQRAE